MLQLVEKYQLSFVNQMQMPFKDSASKIPHWSATFKHSNNRLSYRIKQPVFFIVIEVIKTKAHFVNLANILTETNLLHNNHGKCVHHVVCSSLCYMLTLRSYV